MGKTDIERHLQSDFHKNFIGGKIFHRNTHIIITVNVNGVLHTHFLHTLLGARGLPLF